MRNTTSTKTGRSPWRTSPWILRSQRCGGSNEPAGSDARCSQPVGTRGAVGSPSRRPSGRRTCWVTLLLHVAGAALLTLACSDDTFRTENVAASQDGQAWVCGGDNCEQPWGRSGARTADGTRDFIAEQLGTEEYFFVQMSRANDDSPSVGTPGLDGELNLAALMQAMEERYPGSSDNQECLRSHAEYLLQRDSSEWFFDHKRKMMSEEPASIDCTNEPVAIPGLLHHLIANDTSAYEVTAISFALSLEDGLVQGGAFIESTSGRYVEVPQHAFQFCFEITSQEEDTPTYCLPGKESESRLGRIAPFELSYPSGVSDTGTAHDKQGSLSFATAALPVDVSAPPHQGLLRAHWVIGNDEQTWQRCRSDLRITDGAVELERWYDCERLQFPGLIPIRTNVPPALRSPRMSPAPFRYHVPPETSCGVNEVVGDDIETAGQFGILLRHAPTGPLCLNCHEDLPGVVPLGGALLCPTPDSFVVPDGEFFGDGTTLALGDTEAGPTNARDPRGKPMTPGFVQPLVQYLMGKRSTSEGEEHNEYLSRSELMNKHIHSFNEWFCQDTPERFSRFPKSDEVLSLNPQSATNAFFQLASNGREGVWDLQQARDACADLPEAAPAP